MPHEHILVAVPEHEGLTQCAVCGGAEGSLPTKCPEIKLSADQADAIHAGNLDFDTGPMDYTPKWWNSDKQED